MAIFNTFKTESCKLAIILQYGTGKARKYSLLTSRVLNWLQRSAVSVLVKLQYRQRHPKYFLRLSVLIALRWSLKLEIRKLLTQKPF